MLKRKNDRQPPQRLEEERYPNDYWLDEEDRKERSHETQEIRQRKNHRPL